MRYFAACILMFSSLGCLLANFCNPKADWICNEDGCGRSNEVDQSSGCKWCQEQQDENDRLKNEYYREVLDCEDPTGAPHTVEEAKAYEKGIQKK